MAPYSESRIATSCNHTTEKSGIIEENGHLFTQINQSELLSEFVASVISPLEKDKKGFVRKDKVFISYSHADEAWLQRLRKHLRPLERQGILDVWVDTKIKAGMKWRNEIEIALNTAKVAILLVTADFMDSDFIAEEELPSLLEFAEQDGVIIIPLIISPSMFEHDPILSQFQAFNNLKKPLINMNKSQREEILRNLAVEVVTHVEK
jgi:hypothetical protein